MEVTLNQLSSVESFLPADWQGVAGHTVIVRAYWCAHPIPDLHADTPVVLDLPNLVRAVLFQGTLHYFRVRDRFVTMSGPEEMAFVGSPVEQPVMEEQGPNGTYLLLLVRYASVDEDIGERVVARTKLNIAAGFLAAIQGRNIVHTMICETALQSDGFDADWGLIHHPFTRIQPAVDTARTLAIEETREALASIDAHAMVRAQLALRWYETSLHQFSVDAFLANWIALEALSAPHSPTAVDVHMTLARAHGISETNAKAIFKVDRLAKLRNALVHNGKVVPIMPPIPDYMQMLFSDLLREFLHLPVLGQALAIVEDSESNLHAVIEEAVYMVESGSAWSRARARS